ncbi:MAG TPA: phage tail sheath C-terminal domain-containing protein [Longimicrobium sp.]|jgi:hypothetical protein|uniref:phage tail sheath family protein n=1 Tax=Longimicrobium sp. TaxID=2029185 RepID=UPI002ED80513
MRERLLLGAPGVYPVADDPVRALTGVRMDVAAFVGVAPRGPARLPAFQAPWAVPPRGPANPMAPLRSVAVPVESWSAYRRLFGAFEGPGLLPYAVAAFFEQGGRRAYVVRVVHDYSADDPAADDPAADGYGTAQGTLAGVTRAGSGSAVVLRARNEGSWGNRLRATLSLHTRPLFFDAALSTAAELVLPPDAPIPAGTLLRLWRDDGTAELRFVGGVRDAWRADSPVVERRAELDLPASAVPSRAEIVEASVAVTDLAEDGINRGELHEGMGLSARHPRWMAAVLYRDSALVHPHEDWIGDDLELDDPLLRPIPHPAGQQFTCGRDRYPHIVPEDFFDEWVPGDEEPRGGVHALVETDDVSILCVPDLFSPWPLASAESAEDVVSLAGPEFAPCVELDPPPAVEVPELICADGQPALPDGSAGALDGLALDPVADVALIAGLQGRLVELAETLRQWVVLLDVPPGLTQRQALDWRARFGSAWAAAYHPWLRVARPDDAREPLVAVPPSAFAAGIVARREIAFGVPHGPANEIVVGAVSVLDRVSPRRHDELHGAAINVYLAERDGIRLTAARTLSRDPQWRQLSIRRLMTLLGRTLLQQMQWTVFEPNSARLRDELRRMLEAYLGQLFRANAFRGRTPDESFFVRCDAGLNTPRVVDEGKLLCHVGVAPAEPLEFIVLKLSRQGDGTLLMEE